MNIKYRKETFEDTGECTFYVKKVNGEDLISLYGEFPTHDSCPLCYDIDFPFDSFHFNDIEEGEVYKVTLRIETLNVEPINNN